MTNARAERSRDGVVRATVQGAILASTGVVLLGGPPLANPAVAVAALSPATVAADPAPDCPSPYPAVGHVLGAEGVPDLPPGVTGEVRPYAEAGAAVAAVRNGTDLLLTVTLDGVTRQFTTAPHRLGGDYNRTPGPSDTGSGVVNIVSDVDGAVYVVLVQNNSGAYTRIGWRFDDPCASVAAAVRADPRFTG